MGRLAWIIIILKNKTNILKELGTLSTTVEMGAKNQGTVISFLVIFFHCGKNTWGTLTVVQGLILTSYMPLGKEELLQSLSQKYTTTALSTS